jgi:hypothetical protein
MDRYAKDIKEIANFLSKTQFCNNFDSNAMIKLNAWKIYYFNSAKLLFPL